MGRLRTIRARRGLRGDDGMATAEYAVMTVGGCSLAGVLIKLLTSQSVVGLLMKTLTRAFSFAF